MSNGTAQPDLTSTAYSTGGDAISSYLGALLGRYGTGTVGTGRMAARGLAQFGIKVQRAQFAREQAQYERGQAYEEFARTNPFEAGFEVQIPGGLGNLSPKTLRLLEKNRVKLGQLQTKAQTAKVRAKERKVVAQITAREAKLAPLTDVRISELRGPNAGYWYERGAPAPAWLTRRSVG